MTKNARRIVTILAGICLWGFYIFQEEMSGYGIYTVVSYGTHELSAVIPFVCAGATVVWFLYLMWKIVKKECGKEDKIFTAILLCLILVQGSRLWQMKKIHYTTVFTTIESVDETQQLIEIRGKDTEQVITLESPMLVNGMVETGEQEYMICYEWKEGCPEKGKLRMIERLK